MDAGAGYDGFNFNGYGKGEVLVTIPLGWKVTVDCTNRSGSRRHSCAIVRGVGATAPAFPHASSPDPERGLPPGHAATFTFVALKRGVYRLYVVAAGHAAMPVRDLSQRSESQSQGCFSDALRPCLRGVREADPARSHGIPGQAMAAVVQAREVTA